MVDDLTPVLARLPEPLPPSTLTATVMARIEREAEQHAADTLAAPARRPELRAWLWTFVGIALVLVAFINGWLSMETLPDFTAPVIGRGRPSLMPAGGPFALLVGVGLLVYLAGLFAPLRSGKT